MLLSICIPTYNRGTFLRRTLDSIISQPAWKSGDVEVVISDNKSTDDTPLIIAGFTALHPDRIRSFRHETAIHPHDNFEFALRMGKGKFRKLHNDTLLWKLQMLDEYLQLLRQYSAADVVLTPNCKLAAAYGKPVTVCRNMNDILDNNSYFITWIGSIAFRDEPFLALEDPSRSKGSALTQTDMVLRLAAEGKMVITDGKIYFESMPVPRKTAKSLLRVFSCNFLRMLDGYVPEKIDRKCFERCKKRLLYEYLIPSHFDFFRENPEMEREKYWSCTILYHKNFYFYTSFIRVAWLKVICRIFPHDFLRKVKNKLPAWNK